MPAREASENAARANWHMRWIVAALGSAVSFILVSTGTEIPSEAGVKRVEFFSIGTRLSKVSNKWIHSREMLAFHRFSNV